MRRVAAALALVIVSLVGLLSGVVAIETTEPNETFRKANQLFRDNNFAEAADQFRSLLGNDEAPGKLVVQSMEQLQNCRNQLGDEFAVDSDLRLAIENHANNYSVWNEAADEIEQATHYGVIADQQFTRGYARGYAGRGGVAGTSVDVSEQDRLQALQWRLKAIELANADGSEADAADKAGLQLGLAKSLLFNRSQRQAWALQSLTALDKQPDYLNLSGPDYLPARYAPVNEQGEPILYPIPESWEAAASDGERLHWAVSRAAAVDEQAWEAKQLWADFLYSQFGVHTLQEDMWLWGRGDAADSTELPDEGIVSLHTLAETETIARLANGIQRFSLPDEFNPLRLYQQIADSNAESLNAAAAWNLVQIFLNRRQYPAAAERLQAYINRFGDDGEHTKQALLDNILKPRVSFDPVPTQLAGQKANLSVLFRNANQLSFTARRVDLEAILADTKQFYRQFNPSGQNRFGDEEGGPPNLSSPAQLFDDANVDKYLKKETAAEWTQAVEPRPNHWDRRISVETPLTQAGLYLVDCLVGDGQHRARGLVWIQDTVLIRKPLKDKWLLHVADAKTGQPIVGANLEFFGYGYGPPANQPQQRLLTQNFAARSNAQGVAEMALKDTFQWFAVARTPQGRLALLDFERYWQRGQVDSSYQALKAYGTSDRPMYRPGETVQAKFWLARTVYGDLPAARAVNTTVFVRLHDPQGNQIAERELSTDEYGGCDLAIDLPDSAPLGQYSFQISVSDDATPQAFAPPVRGRGKPRPVPSDTSVITSLAIRVEEYRKPEFEVKIQAPSAPVALGETIQARIEAKYYFGAPVTDAQVSVKVERSTYREDFYPPQPYDWCYGAGYWWFAEDYSWYPGWSRWHGSYAPQVDWIRPRWGFEPPELVLEQDVQLDSTGVAIIDIDTALAKTLFGDEDHRYTISVDVRDSSRRTISAQGTVFAAQEPFKIHSWTEQGFYYVGDAINAHFHARMLDGTPITASGTMDLLRITYDADQKPLEQVVASVAAETDKSGNCQHTFEANRAGQYRVRLRLTDAAGHQVEGAYIFNVRPLNNNDPTLKASDFRYNGLELIPDKKYYAPGDTVKLQIAANREDALVALFVRPVEGVYSAPRWIRLQKKSAIFELQVQESDQPNFFVEAYTVYDGEFHSEVRQIFVPPAERVLDVAISANKEEYLPGEEAEVQISVKDAAGKPVVGSTVIAAYDRSLEQIAGDVLPPDIREFFWKWQRNHSPQQTISLQRNQAAIQINGVHPMMPLGIFGQSLADDADNMFMGDVTVMSAAPGMGGYGGRAMDFSLGMGGAEMAAEGALAAKSMAAAPAPGGGERPTVRQDFADSALWLANIQTNAQGQATAKFKMPDNLTSWKLRTWSVSKQTSVGSASTEVVTRKPLLVRLQTPRFLVESDEVVVSAIVHNDLPDTRSVRVSLEIDGQTQLELIDGGQAEQTVDIESHQQKRVDWRCKATAEGMVTLRVLAITNDASDAMQLEVPIVVHGVLKMDSFAGTVRDGQPKSIATLHIPSERRVEQSRLTVQLSPSLAAAMIDALPYLAEYPYGCTEQTLNRFLPTVITQRVLQQMQVDLAALKDQKQRNNLNAQELGDPQKRSEGWARFDRDAVFDEALVSDMVRDGVQRLTEMQNGDGGWGWFSGVQEVSSPHMTAIVVRGLLVAQQNDVAIVPDVLQRGLAWLEAYQQVELQKLQNAAEEKKPLKPHVDNLDALVFHVLVLADRPNPAMQELLYAQREHLSTYGMTLVAWATHKLGNAQQTAMLRQNIEQFLVEDAENETAFLRDASPWWYWYGSEIEANAMYLKLLSAVEPQGRVAPRVVKYLLNNRKHATYWDSTRDTALVVEAFAAYIQATGELARTMTAEVWLGEKRLGRVEFTPQNLFEVDNTIEIQGAAIPAGEQTLEIRRTGEGNLYWNAYATNFTLEDEVAAAGLEVKIERRFYHLEPVRKDLLLPGERADVVQAEQAAFRRTLIDDTTKLPSGSLVEVELLVQSKNDYEYVLIEDQRPASLEAVDTQSGYFYSAGLSIYRELREKHIGLCIRWLPKGNYSIRYQMRSEAPGQFTGLPAVIQGMYAPELRGNSTDFDLQVVD